MAERMIRRVVMPAEHIHQLPLAVESIGSNPAQEPIARPNGYDYYHWLQTDAGEGVMNAAGKSHSMPVGTGFLLFPGVPHSYHAKEGRWETTFLTFGGACADAVVKAAGMRESTYARWTPESGIGQAVSTMLRQVEQEGDVFGIAASSGTYRFLIMLNRYGMIHGRRTGDPDRLDKVRTVVEWMEARYMEPDIGIEEIAAVLGLSNRRLTGLFRESVGTSPYAYLIQLRLRKAKEQLVRSSPLTVREIAQRVGFRDASHFVATFKRHAGITPEQFRKLH